MWWGFRSTPPIFMGKLRRMVIREIPYNSLSWLLLSAISIHRDPCSTNINHQLAAPLTTSHAVPHVERRLPVSTLQSNITCSTLDRSAPLVLVPKALAFMCVDAQEYPCAAIGGCAHFAERFVEAKSAQASNYCRLLLDPSRLEHDRFS